MRNSSTVCHVRCHVTRYATHCAAREKLQMPFFDDVIHQTMRATMCAGLRRTGAASRPGARRPPGMRAPRVRARPTRACGCVTRLRARTAPHSGQRGGGAWLAPPSRSRSAAAAATAPLSSFGQPGLRGGGQRRFPAALWRCCLHLPAQKEMSLVLCLRLPLVPVRERREVIRAARFFILL